MIKLSNLAEFINDAQVHFFDKYVFCKPSTNDYVVIDVLWESETELDAYYDNSEWYLVKVDSFSSEMIETFINLQHDPVKSHLQSVFRGKGKYRKVKDLFYRYDIIDDFYKFELDYTLNIAKIWCEDNQLEHEL